jgi:hypothetical protein
MLPSSRLSAFPDSKTEWLSGKFFLITVAGPCRTYTGFPFMPLQAPRKLLSQVVQPKALDVNGIKTILTFSWRRYLRGRTNFPDVRDGQHTTRGT